MDQDKYQVNSNQEGSENEHAEIPIEKLSDSAFYRMYLNDVRGCNMPADMPALYDALLNGSRDVMNQITSGWLMRVIEMAKFYKDTPVSIEDVIQEGNMALWLALTNIPDGMQSDRMEDYLIEKIKEGMQNYIREITGDADQVQAIIGKAALLYEAQEYLAKENAQTPSIRELSEFTHIPAEEIQDIFALLKKEED